MPQPFTNQWDQTFPTDSGLVEQGASNLRQLRVDVQQRMAAISGLDAAKPNFSADTQPAQWTGILYFALDTAQVYQWNGSTWLIVTPNIAGGGVLGKNTTPVTKSGSLTESQVYSTFIPALQVNSILRITTYLMVNASPQPMGLSWHYGDGSFVVSSTNAHIMELAYDPIQPGGTPGPALSNVAWMVQLTMQNQGSLSAQVTTGFSVTLNGNGMNGALGQVYSNIDSSGPRILNMSIQDSGAGNTQTFLQWLVELL